MKNCGEKPEINKDLAEQGKEETMKYITERTEIAKFFREHKIIKINKE